MFGKGLLEGLKVTGKIIFRKKVTEEYPEQRPELSDRWRGWFQLDVEECIACNLCAMACPNKVITVKSERDENKKRYLTGYEVETSYCLFCGLCVEACPKKCLSFTQEFEKSEYDKERLNLDLFNNPNLSAPSSTFAFPEREKKTLEEKEEE